MTKALTKALGKYLEDGLQSNKATLEKLGKAVIVSWQGKTGPEAREEAIGQRKATIELYEQLLREFQAGDFDSAAMKMATQIVEDQEKEKLKVKQNKNSTAFELAIISPIIPAKRGNGYQAQASGRSNEITYDLQATNKPSMETLIECRKILHIWNDNFNKTGSHKLEMPLKDYMKLVGVTSASKARDRINRVNDTLLSIRFLSRQDLPKYIRNTTIHLFQGIQTDERKPEPGDTATGEEADYKALYNGKIVLIGSEVLGSLYSLGKVVPLLQINLAIDSQRFPWAYNFYVRLCEHYTWNEGKPNANKISVKALIKAEPKVPSYEYVKTKLGRQYRERIIEPFEKNMAAIRGIKWEYDRPVKTYKDFMAAYILFEVLDNA